MLRWPLALSLIASLVAISEPSRAESKGESERKGLHSPLARAGLRGQLAGRSLLRQGSALLQGATRVGPKHTWHAIKEKPVRYTLMLAGIGLAGASAKAAGVDPEPYALGLSGVTFAWSSWKSWPGIRAARGEVRLQRIGADIVWPLTLVFGTALGGKIVGHGPGGETGASIADVARAGGQSVVIGIDVPTIAQTAMDSPKTQR